MLERTFLKYTVLAAVYAMISSGAASAADLYSKAGSLKDAPAAPASNWTGFYAGANGGYGWSVWDDQFSWDASAAGYGSFSGAGSNGGFGGGQIGYNWQSPGTNFLLGVEADIQGAGISLDTKDHMGIVDKTQLDWFGTVRGRLGYGAGNTLLYFTGGLAYGHIKTSVDLRHVSFGYGYYETDDVETGYVLGGGIEYKFSPQWSIKAEYQYLNFGKNDTSCDRYCIEEDGVAIKHSSSESKLSEDEYHTVRVGLNYHLNQASYIPLK